MPVYVNRGTNKKVKKIVVNGKEVLKIIVGDGTSSGILKYQKEVSPFTGPKYSVMINFNSGGGTNFEIYDNETQTLLSSGSGGQGITNQSSGYKTTEFQICINNALNNWLGQNGKNYNWVLINNMRLVNVFSCTITGTSTTYIRCKQTDIDGLTQNTQLFYTSGNGPRWGSTTITKTMSQVISNYYDSTDNCIYNPEIQNIRLSDIQRYYISFVGYTTASGSTTTNRLTGITDFTLYIDFDLVQPVH